MNHKTLILVLGILALFGLGIAVSLDRAYSEDGQPAALPSGESGSDRDRAMKPTLQDLRAEINTLRADVQKVLALLQNNPNGGRPGQADAVEVDAADKVTIFKLEFVPPHHVAEVIQNVILDARVSVLPDENRLVVVANTAGSAKAAQTIAQLDRPRQQVQIESYVYEIPVDDLARLGLISDDEPGEAITSRLGKHFDFKTTLDALSATEGARLLARPNIRAYDRTTATFEAIQEIPVRSFTRTELATIGTTEFREAGIRMEVTPQVTTGGKIIMEVHPEFSVMNGFIDGQPVIDRRSAVTTVVAKSGEPIVISGLRSQRQHFTDERSEPNEHETELLIIIKAEIVADDDE